MGMHITPEGFLTGGRDDLQLGAVVTLNDEAVGMVAHIDTQSIRGEPVSTTATVQMVPGNCGMVSSMPSARIPNAIVQISFDGDALFHVVFEETPARRSRFEMALGKGR